jgi:hypothetical protein
MASATVERQLRCHGDWVPTAAVQPQKQLASPRANEWREFDFVRQLLSRDVVNYLDFAVQHFNCHILDGSSAFSCSPSNYLRLKQNSGF